jgi:hypothetical protein
MSFDVFLQRFSAGRPAQVSRDQVLSVLQTTKFNGPRYSGFYVVEFPDGVDVEFSAKGLDGSADFEGCAFHIRGMSPLLVAFILEIAKAGDMVILPAMEGFVPILTSPEQKIQLPTELAENEPKPVVCSAPDELESLLCGGYNGWQKYRDKVLNEKRGF